MNYFSFFSTLYLFLPIIIKEYNLGNESIGTIGLFYSLGSVISGFSLSNYIEKSTQKNILFKLIILSKILFLISLIFIKNYFFLIFSVFMIGYLGASFIGSNISRSKNKGITIGISSIGFIIGYLLGGIIEDYQKMLLIICGLFTISFILSFIIPPFNEGKTSIEEEKSNSLEILKQNWFIYLALFLRHTGAASIWMYFSYILLHYYHLNLYTIGILNTINILVQTISNPIIYKIINKDNNAIFKMISIGYILSAIYFLLFPLFKDVWILSILQVILGLSFTALYLGNIEYLSENNKEKIISITLVSSTFSFANSVGALISVILIKNGYIWLFINGFILSLSSFILMLSINKNLKHKHYEKTIGA
ncbi:MAG: MFS transporter [Candidatus Calescibacterium sp.]|nr:MFS transporter [Candidatus Calescibacterium sp.]MDW8133058.1 MFS transporter [Candidatus Calescibacterium sp.]